jgi:AraC-like DNA-binding protein
MSAIAIPAVYVRHLAEVLRQLRVPTAPWLAQQGISPADLDDPAWHATFERFEALVRDALTRTGEQALGLIVGERLLANTHGMVGYAALQSGTIRQAIDLFRRFARLRLALLHVDVEEDGEVVWVRLRASRPLGDVERPILEAVVLSVKNLLDAITRDPRSAARVAFPFPEPPYGAMAREILAATVGWSQPWCGVAVRRADLDQPLRQGDPAAFAEAAQLCQRALEQLDVADDWAGRVRRLLLERQHGFPSLATVARRLHTTPRTLHRRLADAGVSFQDLLDTTRASLAGELLRTPNLTVEDVAFQLGYTEVANFRRAFRRWTGLSPAAWRAAEVSADPPTAHARPSESSR